MPRTIRLHRALATRAAKICRAFVGDDLELLPDPWLRGTNRFGDPCRDPCPLGPMEVAATPAPVGVGTELPIVQSGIPGAIPQKACCPGWLASLPNLARLVEPDIG